MKFAKCHPEKPLFSKGLCKSCYQKNHYHANKEIKERKRLQKQKYSLKDKLKKYNIALEEYEKLQTKQNEKCAICNVILPLFIDHNHKTNKVRGLLCINCNFGIGHFRDSKYLLQAAMDYLDEND